MQLQTSIAIHAPKAEVWKVISNIEGSADTIKAIHEIEVIERPANGLVGFKWKETRTMFGKEASEVMWITDVEDGTMYKTRAESHGAVYISWFTVEENDGVTTLTMGFDGQSQTFMAKLMSMLMGPMMKKSTLKAIEEDLADIKAAVENTK